MLQKQRFTESNPAAEEPRILNRRAFLGAASAAAAISAVMPQALAQTQGFPVGPAPIRYPDAVWKVLDDRFKK
jgi:hypothetical protein